MKEDIKLTVDSFGWRKTPLKRISQPVADLLERKNYYIDVHTHLFDINCINKAYFIIRMLKDLLGLKSVSQSYSTLSLEQAYTEKGRYDEDWANSLIEELENNKEIQISYMNTKGIIDLFNAKKLLGLKKMEDVYNYYLAEFSLNEGEFKNKEVLTTAIMMDLEMGWGCKLKKNIRTQILELKELAAKKPILPFLVCDPRRAEIQDPEKNLYSLFNLAFSAENGACFFGVKIYPALGYDPSDYRLWPIYEICEKYSIPVLSHCGGESVSTSQTELMIYEGDKKVLLKEKNRKEVAYKLNDPARWRLVLEKFKQLKLNIAHFGGYETWGSTSELDYNGQKRKETIFEFMRTYENVYADFSFNLVEQNLTQNLVTLLNHSNNTRIKDRTLFGTDYWVVNKEGNLKTKQEDFMKTLSQGPQGPALVRSLTIDNSYKYLFSTNDVITTPNI